MSDLDAEELGYFANAGLCPVGRSLVVKDEYLNMATRTIEGRDAVVYYDFETSFGDFALTYADTRTTTLNKHQLEALILYRPLLTMGLTFIYSAGWIWRSIG